MGLSARLPAVALAWIFLGTCVQLPATNSATAATDDASATAPQQRVQDRFALQGQAIQGGLLRGTAPRGTTLLTFDGVSVDVAPDRRFVIGFDRDAQPLARLSARLVDGREIAQTINVSPRAWDISRLNTLPKYPVPRPEFERRRAPELAQINAARAMHSDAQGWRQEMLWPVLGRISTLFGSQRIYKGEPGSYHSGIDIARPTGTRVMAPADGVVVLATAAPFTLEGNLLMIDHGAGLNSAFMHLSRIDVRVGAVVRRGQTVGAIGMSGRATGPHLHWGIKWHSARIDPLLLAGPMPVAD